MDIEITDKVLLRIAITITILGIIALAIITSKEIPETGINTIQYQEDNTQVKIIGVVEQSTVREKTLFLNVSQKCSTTIIVFNPTDIIPKGSSIVVEGKVSSYQGTHEIIADNIQIT